MNKRKIAEALRLLAEALEEEVEPANDTRPLPEPVERPRRRKPTREPYRPSMVPDEVSMRNAAALLAQAGIVPRGKL